MSEETSKAVRLSKVAREFNLGLHTVVEFLDSKGHKVEQKPNTKIPADIYSLLQKEFGQDKEKKQKSKSAAQPRPERESITIKDAAKGGAAQRKREGEEVFIHNVQIPGSNIIKPKVDRPTLKVVDKIDLDKKRPIAPPPVPPAPPVSTPKPEVEVKKEAAKPVAKVETPAKTDIAPADKASANTPPAPAVPAPTKEAPAAAPPVAAPADDSGKVIKAEAHKLSGPTVVGKIDLPKEREKKSKDRAGKRRKRIIKPKVNIDRAVKQADETRRGTRGRNEEPDAGEVKKKIAATLARLTKGGKSKGSRHRKQRRDDRYQSREREEQQRAEQDKVLKLTEFVTVAELASMMSIQATDVISACLSLGMMVSINQRLDAETITVVSEEFGFETEFVSAEVQENVKIAEDNPDNIQSRAPIVTVMGHVDHGKTSLLDHIRQANVIAGEAGGITQHIGAYSVELDNGKRIAFLDTPGHEAFTAMRARGAQITDIAVIVIAADDSVMPQTKEAINHAQAAGVPMVFAINKVDKDGADPEKIKQELASMDLLVEDWGGKYQSQEISAKQGTNIKELLDKVLLEAELLELKADPDRRANGAVVESSLEHGRGYVTTILVQGGTLRKGDIMLAGQFSGRVRAMYNERGQNVDEAGPSTPVSILGLDGAATAGDRFLVMEDDREARQIATRRQQLQREQGIRTHKHITLDEIGRRIAIGDFQELNIIVKGDVDGSVEALTDSLIKLSIENISVKVIHKAVGPIAESDVLLATASNAIIIGFQVRPTPGARKLAEAEEIDIRLYSIIYQAIDEVKAAMEGMLSPDVKENIMGTAEIRETFKISKVGTIAGCFVIDGKINRKNKVRVIRDGIVVYTGELGSLKRFKDDVKEVGNNYECGLNIEKFNDIKVGDLVEAYEEVEVARKLE